MDRSSWISPDDKSIKKADAKRQRAIDREPHILDPRVRKIGIDVDAIQRQIQEKKELQAREKAREDAFDHQTLEHQRLLLLGQKRYNDQVRQLNVEREDFRRTYQRPEQCREFDIWRKDYNQVNAPIRYEWNDPALMALFPDDPNNKPFLGGEVDADGIYVADPRYVKGGYGGAAGQGGAGGAAAGAPGAAGAAGAGGAQGGALGAQGGVAGAAGAGGAQGGAGGAGGAAGAGGVAGAAGAQGGAAGAAGAAGANGKPPPGWVDPRLGISSGQFFQGEDSTKYERQAAQAAQRREWYEAQIKEKQARKAREDAEDLRNQIYELQTQKRITELHAQTEAQKAEIRRQLAADNLRLLEEKKAREQQDWQYEQAYNDNEKRHTMRTRTIVEEMCPRKGDPQDYRGMTIEEQKAIILEQKKQMEDNQRRREEEAERERQWQQYEEYLRNEGDKNELEWLKRKQQVNMELAEFQKKQHKQQTETQRYLNKDLYGTNVPDDSYYEQWGHSTR